MKVKLKNGVEADYPSGVVPQEILNSSKIDLDKKYFAAHVNGLDWDLSRPLVNEDCEIEFLSWEDPRGKNIFWHSSAHLMAEAVQYYFPKAKFGIGPPVETGFYYDIDFGDDTPTNEDLQKIEKKAIKLAAQNEKYHRMEVSKKEAIDFFTKNYDPYKLELLENLEEGNITLYKQGNFTDLCRGVHLPSTFFIKAFKITSIAGAYWRGDIKRKQLTRVYGVSFPSKEELDTYLYNLEEAKKRDHKKIGRDLKIYALSEKVGIGLPLWLPNGAIIRHKIMDYFYKDQLKNGYLPVVTPHIGRKDLYVTSGHYDKYGEDSFQPIKVPNEKDEYMLKPMNCPHHCEIYKTEIRSHWDLPIRLAEFGTVYRYEKHGELNGITRTRCLTQDDAHIFCTQEQVPTEIFNTITRVKKTLEALSFENYAVRLSTRDKNNLEKYIGDKKDWELAENAMKDAMKNANITYEEGEGEAAFYGPKLDFLVKDSLARKWQLGTIQLDYQLPKRFQLHYISPENTKKTPVMIHRAPMGSLERLIAILLEHTSGNLPLWLCPIQVVVITISKDVSDYAKNIVSLLKNEEISCEGDLSAEKLTKKILKAETKKIPYMVVIGNNEKEKNKITVRQKGSRNSLEMTLEELIQKLKNELEKFV